MAHIAALHQPSSSPASRAAIAGLPRLLVPPSSPSAAAEAEADIASISSKEAADPQPEQPQTSTASSVLSERAKEEAASSSGGARTGPNLQQPQHPAEDGGKGGACISSGRYASCAPDEPCPVCHEGLQPMTEVVEMPCKHCFHEECLLPWFQEVRREQSFGCKLQNMACGFVGLSWQERKLVIHVEQTPEVQGACLM